jgi:predicted methyltransferase
MCHRVSNRQSGIAASALAVIALGAMTLVWSPGQAQAQAAPDYAALMAAPDRSDADRTADKRRDPVKLLAFAGVRPGMKVLDMGANAGYSTEVMARAVAPNGTVWGQNPPDLGDRPKTAFEARTKTPAGKNIVALMRPFDDPVPAEVANLDLITFLFFYHDTGYMAVDRAAMNRKLFGALKPGGFLVIADHSAKAGEGINGARTVHRVEESLLRREVEAAGFKLVAEGDFWRHPEDPRDFSPNRPTGPVDEFVHKYQKPN